MCCLLAAGCAAGAEMKREVILATMNQVRRGARLRPLQFEKRLQKAAQFKADDMVRVGYFSHTGIDGKKPWDLVEEAGYAYAKVAENLAEGQQTPEALRDAWMESPAHRENVLEKRFVHTGIGIARRGARYVVVQVFAAPAVREEN